MRMRIAFFTFSAMLIAAHFLRAGNVLVAAFCLATPLLFLIHQPWTLRVLQVLAYAATATWLWTAWELAVLRLSANQPWTMAVAILLAVAALSALSGILLRKNDAAQGTAPESRRE